MFICDFLLYTVLMDFIAEDGRIYAENADGKVVAEITWTTSAGCDDGQKIATIDHTFVDESLRGQGIAGQLMQAAVKKIQADKSKIAATCSYAVSWLEKHPEVPHVQTDAPIACKVGAWH